MPVIFIHGVNTRDDTPDYFRDLAVRNELLSRLVLQPLAAKGGPHFARLEIVNPYWGGDGVKFYWDQVTLPKVEFLEHLGPEIAETPQADVDLTTTVQELAARSSIPSSSLEPLGLVDNSFSKAAMTDLPQFMEAVLSPIIVSEMKLPKEMGLKDADIGVREALLLLAAREVSHNDNVLAKITASASNRQVIDILKEATRVRFRQLLEKEGLLQVIPAPEEGELEPLGRVADFFKNMWNRVEEVFDRALSAPARAPTVAALDGFRKSLHQNVALFFGDVFIYLKERDGEDGRPGPIVSAVIEKIINTPRRQPNEPLIIITHSMGGNIFYDILTHYRSNLVVNAWISVASQVGQFEEMKLFKVSDKNLKAPDKVKGLRARVKYWLNIYDPADILGFKAQPVFADTDEDVEFLTGASAFKAHGAYFKRPSFYDLVRERLESKLL